MDKFSTFHISGQKISFPKAAAVVVMWFLGLSVVAEYYAAMPVFLDKHIPKDLYPGLVKFALHLITSIVLTGVGYAIQKVNGFFGICRKYPRSYVYCHQRSDGVEHEGLVFGHFTITCSAEQKFSVHGVSYHWTGTELERQSEWSSLAMTPNTDLNSNEVFLIFVMQPVAEGPPKNWIAGFKKSEHEGVIAKHNLYEVVLQEFSWEQTKQFRGFAELVADVRWWDMRRHHKLSSEELQKKITSNLLPLANNFRVLFPKLDLKKNQIKATV